MHKRAVTLLDFVLAEALQYWYWEGRTAYLRGHAE